MKTKIFISSLSLIAASINAQPSVPAGASPSANRPEVSRPATPSMPQVGSAAKPLSGPALNAAVPVIESRIVPFTGNDATNSVSAGASGSVAGVSSSGGDGSRGGNVATPKPPSTMYSGVGPLPANDAKAPTSVGASQSGAQAQVEPVVQDRKAQAKSNAQYRKSDAQTNAQEKLAPYYTGDVDVPSLSGYPPSHPALGGKLEEVIYVATPVTPTTVGATGVTTPMPPLPANDAKGPTSVGAAGLATPLPKGAGPTPLKNDDVGTNSYVLFTTDIIVTNYNNDVAPPPPLPQSKPLPPSAKQEAQTKAQGLAAKAQAFSEAREKIYYEMSDKEAAKKASANPDGAKTSK